MKIGNKTLTFLYWLARVVLPKRLVYICAMQVICEATTGKYGNTVVPDIGAMEATKRYYDEH